MAIVTSYDDAGIEWALGGALALAYATEEPRATRAIDMNVYVDSSDVDQVFAALPPGVAHGADDDPRVARLVGIGSHGRPG